jgi:hypothetical protein
MDRERGVAFLSCDPGRDLWNSVLVSLIFPFLFFEEGRCVFLSGSFTSLYGFLDLLLSACVGILLLISVSPVYLRAGK